MVTNCTKERPGSIVTKTLKNGILIPIATSKESHFNADFKYKSFIKFSSYPSKVMSLRNIFLILENREKHLLKVIESEGNTPSNSAYQRTLLKFQAPIYKNVEFCIFCQKADHECVFICLFFVFFPGVIVSTQLS